MDYGHAETDRRLKKLEKALTAQYGVANKELTKKVRKYFDQFAKEDAKMLEKLNKNKITKEEYAKWRTNKMLVGEQWREIRDTIAKDLTNVNKISAKMITGEMVNAYALNTNYGIYEIEKGTNTGLSFSLYSKETVERMIQDKKFPIKPPKVDVPKDQRWNKQKINSAMLQGVLQGDSIPKLSRRLEGVTNMNRSSAIRNARTYITGAENRGRVDSYKYAESLGIQLEQMWIATLDGRTRDSHRQLDGETAKVGEEFSNGCAYPGDPDGPAEEIYNCRCTLIASLEKYGYSKQDMLGRKSGMTEKDYEEWKRGKQKEGKKEGKKEDRQEIEIYKKELEENINKGLEYKRFESKDDVKKWAEKNHILITDDALNKLDLRTFNESSVVLDEMFNRFPEVAIDRKFEWFDGTIKDFIFRIDTVDGWGELMTANGGLNFNVGYFKDYERGLRNALDGQTDGFTVKGDGTFGTLIRHEFGHNVQDYIEMKINEKYHHVVDDWRINFSSLEEYRKSEKLYWEERKQFDSELAALAGLKGSSEYSNTNTMELFAEGFAEWSSGGKSEFANAFGEFLRRWY